METLVLVLRLLKVIATVFPVKDPRIDFGIEPDFMDRLCEWAFRTRVVNSGGLRSAIDKR